MRNVIDLKTRRVLKEVDDYLDSLSSPPQVEIKPLPDPADVVKSFLEKGRVRGVSLALLTDYTDLVHAIEQGHAEVWMRAEDAKALVDFIAPSCACRLGDDYPEGFRDAAQAVFISPALRSYARNEGLVADDAWVPLHTNHDARRTD